MGGAFGRYEIVRELGRGGQAVVYEARDVELARRVALKVLLPGARAAPAAERLLREARAAAKLSHPGIVSVYDAGELEGRLFLAMEYVDGPSLAEIIASRPIRPREAVEIIAALADAAHCAHLQGIVHRDIKPSNVLIAPVWVPKLSDFGFALDALTTGEEQSRLTRTGEVMGTPAYMSPEQAGGKSREADARSDVWSLGAVLYEMLARRPPFEAEGSLELLEKIVGARPRRPSELCPGVPRDAETVCLKCLAKEPSRRYASAGELAADARRFLRGEPVLARPASAAYRARRALRAHAWAVAAAAVAVVLLAGVAVRARARLAPLRGKTEAAREEVARWRVASDAVRAEVAALRKGLARARAELERARAEADAGAGEIGTPGTPETLGTPGKARAPSGGPALPGLPDAAVPPSAVQPAARYVAVPNVVGSSPGLAATVLRQAGLERGRVTFREAAGAVDERVASQSPAAGSVVASGTRVDVVVHRPAPGVAVPSVIGWLEANATEALRKAGFRVSGVARASHATLGEGRVIRQSPSAGVLVEPGTGVGLVVSTGSRLSTVPGAAGRRRGTVRVPNVTGRALAAGEEAIRRAGLVVGAVSAVPGPNVGRIAWQRPSPGAPVARASKVDIGVYVKAPASPQPPGGGGGEPPPPARPADAPRRVRVPALVGMTLAEAREAVDGAGLMIGAVGYDRSSARNRGLVLLQYPASGATVPRGTPVGLRVGR